MPLYMPADTYSAFQGQTAVAQSEGSYQDQLDALNAVAQSHRDFHEQTAAIVQPPADAPDLAAGESGAAPSPAAPASAPSASVAPAASTLPAPDAPVTAPLVAPGNSQRFSPFDDVFARHAGALANNPEFMSIVAAGTLAESGWNPGNTTGDGGHSWGLFQMHDGGAGAGMGNARLDPDAASAVMVPKYAQAYLQAKAANPNLSGPGLAAVVAQAAERSADSSGSAYASAYRRLMGGQAEPAPSQAESQPQSQATSAPQGNTAQSVIQSANDLWNQGREAVTGAIGSTAAKASETAGDLIQQAHDTWQKGLSDILSNVKVSNDGPGLQPAQGGFPGEGQTSTEAQPAAVDQALSGVQDFAHNGPIGATSAALQPVSAFLKDYQAERAAADQHAQELMAKSGVNDAGLAPDEKDWLNHYRTDQAAAIAGIDTEIVGGLGKALAPKVIESALANVDKYAPDVRQGLEEFVQTSIKAGHSPEDVGNTVAQWMKENPPEPIRSTAEAAPTPANPFQLATEGTSPLSEDQVTSHIEYLGQRYEQNAGRIEDLENRLAGGSLRSDVQRPPWSGGITNDALRRIAEDHGTTASKPTWWEEVGLDTGSAEVRENVGQGGYRGSGNKALSPTEARSELRRLQVEQDQLLAAADHAIDSAGEGKSLYQTANVSDELPWQEYNPNANEPTARVVAPAEAPAGSQPNAPTAAASTGTPPPTGDAAGDVFSANGRAAAPEPELTADAPPPTEPPSPPTDLTSAPVPKGTPGIGGLLTGALAEGKKSLFSLSNFHPLTIAYDTLTGPAGPAAAAKFVQTYVGSAFTGAKGNIANAGDLAPWYAKLQDLGGLRGVGENPESGAGSNLPAALKVGARAAGGALFGAGGGYQQAKATGASDEDAATRAVIMGAVGAALGPTVAERMHQALWTDAVPLAKVLTFKAAVEGGANEAEAAKYVTNLMGGQNLAKIAGSQPVLNLIRLGIQAPDWLISQLKLGRDAGIGVAKSVPGVEAIPKVGPMTDSQRLSRDWLVKTLALGGFITEALQVGLTGHTTLDNQPGHQFQLEIPNASPDKRGLPDYTTVSFFPGNLQPLLNLASSKDVGGYISGRIGPVPSLYRDLSTNTQYPGGPNIVMPGAPPPQALAADAMHVAQRFAPIGLTGPTQQVSRGAPPPLVAASVLTGLPVGHESASAALTKQAQQQAATQWAQLEPKVRQSPQFQAANPAEQQRILTAEQNKVIADAKYAAGLPPVQTGLPPKYQGVTDPMRQEEIDRAISKVGTFNRDPRSPRPTSQEYQLAARYQGNLNPAYQRATQQRTQQNRQIDLLRAPVPAGVGR